MLLPPLVVPSGTFQAAHLLVNHFNLGSQTPELRKRCPSHDYWTLLIRSKNHGSLPYRPVFFGCIEPDHNTSQFSRLQINSMKNRNLDQPGLLSVWHCEILLGRVWLRWICLTKKRDHFCVPNLHDGLNFPPKVLFTFQCPKSKETI